MCCWAKEVRVPISGGYMVGVVCTLCSMQVWESGSWHTSTFCSTAKVSNHYMDVYLGHVGSKNHQEDLESARPDTRWPDGDFRNQYFPPARLAEAVDRVEQLKGLVPPAMSLPEMALRFILSHPAVSTVIPGMRRLAHVEGNMAAGRASNNRRIEHRPHTSNLQAECFSPSITQIDKLALIKNRTASPIEAW